MGLVFVDKQDPATRLNLIRDLTTLELALDGDQEIFIRFPILDTSGTVVVDIVRVRTSSRFVIETYKTILGETDLHCDIAAYVVSRGDNSIDVEMMVFPESEVTPFTGNVSICGVNRHVWSKWKPESPQIVRHQCTLCGVSQTANVKNVDENDIDFELDYSGS